MARWSQHELTEKTVGGSTSSTDKRCLESALTLLQQCCRTGVCIGTVPTELQEQVGSPDTTGNKVQLITQNFVYHTA